MDLKFLIFCFRGGNILTKRGMPFVRGRAVFFSENADRVGRTFEGMSQTWLEFFNMGSVFANGKRF